MRISTKKKKLFSCLSRQKYFNRPSWLFHELHTHTHTQTSEFYFFFFVCFPTLVVVGCVSHSKHLRWIIDWKVPNWEWECLHSKTFNQKKIASEKIAIWIDKVFVSLSLTNFFFSVFEEYPKTITIIITIIVLMIKWSDLFSPRGIEGQRERKQNLQESVYLPRKSNLRRHLQWNPGDRKVH